MRRRAPVVIACLVSAIVAASTARGSEWTSLSESIGSSLASAYAPGSLPLAFEENIGQSHPAVRYVARGNRFDAFLTDGGAHIAVRTSAIDNGAVVHIPLHASRGPNRPDASIQLPGAANYFIGSDDGARISDVRTFERVTYRSVFPGIDVVFHGTQSELEYDLVVSPRGKPEEIALQFRGCDLALTSDGALALRMGAGSVQFGKPVAYQDIRGERRTVEARYKLLGGDRVGFRVGRYDRNHPLVIDPILSLSTNLWGTATGVALDAANNIYVVGYTTKNDLLPMAGGYQTQVAGDVDAYVAKLNPTGTAAIFTTYLGARRATTNGLAIVVDSGSNVYITGTTTSSAFPITPGALQSTGTTFLTKLKAAGNALGYSTFVSSPVAALAVDGAGNAYLTGTTSTLTPTTGAFQSSRLAAASPYVAKINAAGTAQAYATYLGGSGNDDAKGIAVDSLGNAYVIGVARSGNFPTQNALRSTLDGTTDAFVAKLNPSGSALVYSTYLGGAQDERGFGIAVDGAGQAIAVGWTTSNDFPIASPFQSRIGYYDSVNHSITNAFITKLNAAGNGLVFSSYLGGKWCLTATVNSCLSFFGPDEGIDVATSVAIDASGYVYVGGYATSTEFPLVDSMESMDASAGDGWHVPLVVKLTTGGDRVIYASVLGARIQDGKVLQIAADGAGGAVAVGATPYTQFPLSGGALQGGGFSFLFKTTPGIYPTSVQSSANPVGRSQPITLTAYATGPAGGVVTFKDGATTLGTANVFNGLATMSATLAPGIHRITATNSADSKVSPTWFQIVAGQ